jgi:hypothetical protein
MEARRVRVSDVPGTFPPRHKPPEKHNPLLGRSRLDGGWFEMLAWLSLGKISSCIVFLERRTEGSKPRAAKLFSAHGLQIKVRRLIQGARVEPEAEGHAMFHTIEFAHEFEVDLEVSPKHRLERMLIYKGIRLQAQIKPYVVETEDGPVEMADLVFTDGTTTRMMPFESFSFVE